MTDVNSCDVCNSQASETMCVCVEARERERHCDVKRLMKTVTLYASFKARGGEEVSI